MERDWGSFQYLQHASQHDADHDDDQDADHDDDHDADHEDDLGGGVGSQGEEKTQINCTLRKKIQNI